MSEEEKSYQSFADMEREAQEDDARKEIRSVANIQDDELEDEPASVPKVKTPWINFSQINFTKDFKNLSRQPFWIVMNILFVLFLCLFLLLFAHYLEDLEYEELIAHVSIHHEMPKNFKGEIPEEAAEIIHHYKIKKVQMQEALKLVKEDPRIHDPVMGDFYPEVLTNQDVILILEAQDIGLVTRSGAVKTELMNLSGLNLTKVSFHEMNNFERSDLRYTNFEAISQPRMNFKAASLEYAQFVDAEIDEANFTRARLDNANFYNVDAPYSTFTGVIAPRAFFQEARLENSKFDNGLFKDSDFSAARLRNSSAKYAMFEAVMFRDADLRNVDFKGANLRGASFVEADLRGVDFTNANLDGANFEGADIGGVNFSGTQLNQANFLKVKNATEQQFKSSETKIGILNIPDYVFPKQRSYKTRFRAPSTPY